MSDSVFMKSNRGLAEGFSATSAAAPDMYMPSRGSQDASRILDDISNAVNSKLGQQGGKKKRSSKKPSKKSSKKQRGGSCGVDQNGGKKKRSSKKASKKSSKKQRGGGGCGEQEGGKKKSKRPSKKSSRKQKGGNLEELLGDDGQQGGKKRRSSKKPSKKSSKKQRGGSCGVEQDGGKKKRSSKKPSKKSSRKSSRKQSGGMPKFMEDLMAIKKEIKSDNSDLKDGPAMSKVASEFLKKAGSVKGAVDLYMDDKKGFEKKLEAAKKAMEEKRAAKKASKAGSEQSRSKKAKRGSRK